MQCMVISEIMFYLKKKVVEMSVVRLGAILNKPLNKFYK